MGKRMGRTVINKIASVYSKTDDYGNNNIKKFVLNQINSGNLLDASAKKHLFGLRRQGSNCLMRFKP